MAKHAKTIRIIEAAAAVLERHHPMTVRQIYYQLVSGQVIENNRGQYQAVSNALVFARKQNLVPWEWIEDRLRRPRTVSMWSDLSDFARTARNAYRRDVWNSQEHYLETWLEKDALSGIFEEILDEYGVTLNVGRGYDGWDSIRNAARRFGDGSQATVLYFGDFDPSGEDMVRSLKERLGFFHCYPEITKCALTAKDVTAYNLPPDFTKASDTRRKAFVDKYGDVSVELDALPIDSLIERLRSEIEKRIDMKVLRKVRTQESRERKKLAVLLAEAT